MIYHLRGFWQTTIWNIRPFRNLSTLCSGPGLLGVPLVVRKPGSRIGPFNSFLWWAFPFRKPAWWGFGPRLWPISLAKAQNKPIGWFTRSPGNFKGKRGGKTFPFSGFFPAGPKRFPLEPGSTLDFPGKERGKENRKPETFSAGFSPGV